jgi:hypothetical protein
MAEIARGVATPKFSKLAHQAVWSGHIPSTVLAIAMWEVL